MIRKMGFTLIELLVVIAIILILGTITVVGLSLYKERAKMEATRALLARIQMGLGNYHTQFEDYPPSEGQWESSQNLYYYLGKKLEFPTGFDPITQEPAQIQSFGPAIEFKNQDIDGEYYIIDVWKNRLYYKKPGENHEADKGKDNSALYDLSSNGPDGQPYKAGFPGDDDDINNWKISR